ncbi:MAG TPA: 4-(cytidine 5'-diphospho)-2-C-methyl-D-erythritol kinase, partial [Actinopolymorphaceae bacterium]
MTPRPAVVVRTPAKINLALMVGPVRPDGFHDLASVYQAVDLYDEVRAESAPAGEISVVVSGPGADRVPLGRDNLAVQAARMLADQLGADEGVRLSIRKGIPVAGGMAGGSSDAAAALVACDALWKTGLDWSDLLTLAARLGSDVPFCVLGGTALGTGHGELVTPLPVRGEYTWVLAFDSEGLSTPAVY